MKAVITVQMDSDAFNAPMTPATELARILRDLATRIETDGDMDDETGHGIALLDINGNTCGRFFLERAS